MSDTDPLSSLRTATFAAGEPIIEQDTFPGKLFFLKEGRVEVVREGTRVALIKTPGSVVGEMSLLLNTKTTASVLALEPSTLFVADEPLEFLRSHPDIHLQVSRALAFRLDSATRYLLDVKDQLKGFSDHVGMVDSVLDTILHRDLKGKIRG